MNGRIIPAAACLLATAALKRASAQQRPSTIVVSVADASTGVPLSNAQVRIPSLGRIAHADWLGEVRFAGVPSGRYTVQVRAIGYAPSDIALEAQGDTIGAVFRLERAPVPLDTVRGGDAQPAGRP